MVKQTVIYSQLLYANVGGRALLLPVDHPNPKGFVSNSTFVSTSLVLSYDQATGRIETENSIYIPK